VYALISMIAVCIALFCIILTTMFALNKIAKIETSPLTKPSASTAIAISIGLSVGVALGSITGMVLGNIPVFLLVGASTSVVISIIICGSLAIQRSQD